jgi:hypothetical protein
VLDRIFFIRLFINDTFSLLSTGAGAAADPRALHSEGRVNGGEGHLILQGPVRNLKAKSHAKEL